MLRKILALGFTLIEALVVLMVLGVLLALAVPSFRDFIETQRLKSAANEMLGDMAYARSEALARQGDAVSLEAIEVVWSATGYTINRLKNSVVQTPPLKQATLDAALSLSGGTFLQNRLVFDTLRGMANAGQITLGHSGVAGTLTLNVNALGVASLCSTNITGFKSCPKP